MTSINFYARNTIINCITHNLNQINQRYFEGTHGKLSVVDNGDYVTVSNHNKDEYFDVQNIFDALNNFSLEDFTEQDCYDLWDYLDNCKYTFPENQETDNELKTDKELSFSEKRQIDLVNWLLDEPVITKTSISNEELWQKNQELTKLTQELKWENSDLSQSLKELHDFRRRENKEGSEIVNHLTARIHELEQNKKYNEEWIGNLKQRVHDLECAVYLLQQETSQITVLNELQTQLHIRIHELEQENKQLKSNQSEAKPEPQPEPKLTDNKAKKPKFKLPENFTDYQQECDDLIDALSCFYDIKKGKWGKDILQFILTPTDTYLQKTKLPYPDKWKAGLYLQPGQWTIDKVKLADPDDWEEWFMDINDFADSNGIEIS